MSNITVQGNASGSGVITLESPNTNSNRTVTLPDETGTLLTSVSSTIAFLAADQTFTGAQRGTFTNITAGQAGNIILVNGSNYTIGQAATTKVSATALATISATGTYWLSYYSPDGTNVYVANTAALA
jgi:hypothetical protein